MSINATSNPTTQTYETLEDVQQQNPIPEETSSKAGRSLMAIAGAYAFLWHAGVGTAITLERKVVALANNMATTGKEFEVKTKQDISSRVQQVTDTTEEKISGLAQQRMSAIEKLVDNGIAKSLRFMRVPSRNDMDQLTSLVKDMSDSIALVSAQIQQQDVNNTPSKNQNKNVA